MNNLVSIFVVGIIVLGIYRLFELFVRRKERMAIIEKLGEQIKLSEVNVDLNLPLFQQSKDMSNSNWALKISLLLVGIGVGLVAGYIMEFASIESSMTEYYQQFQFDRKIEVVYFACVAIFGGLGLLIAYFIEQRKKS